MSWPGQPGRRSDDIRRRRALQSHSLKSSSQTAKSAGKFGGLIGGTREARRRTSSVHAPPPVMARRFAAAASRPAGAKMRGGRRKHRLSLGASGAEMSLPAMPHIGFGWRLASFVILAGLLAAIYYLWTAPDFQVEAAQISGLKSLTRGDVNRELALQSQPIFMLDEGDLQARLLESFPEFSSAEVMIELPNTLLITVTERTPVMIWRQDERSILVDADGKTFQAREQAALGSLPVIDAAGDPPPVPEAAPSLDETESPEKVLVEEIQRDVVQEFMPTQMFEPQTVMAILALAKEGPKNVTLVYEPDHGFGWLDPRGWPVYLGDLSDLEIKMAEYRAILKQIKAAGGTPELISVEFVHAPYFRLKEQGAE